MKKITAFILFKTDEQFIKSLQKSDFINKIFIVNPESAEITKHNKCKILNIDNVLCSEAIQIYAENITDEYALFLTEKMNVELRDFSLKRFIDIAEDLNAGMLYSDYQIKKNGDQINHPVIDYQKGSLRDDFNFGALQFYKSSVFKIAAENSNEKLKFAALYLLRLKISQQNGIARIPEYLYSVEANDIKKSEKNSFDYLDDENRQVQIEMEKAVTIHLKDINAYLIPSEYKKIYFSKNNFKYEASVIIPVKNREKTIASAIKSVLLQKTKFKFNIIIVDNHSTDKTTEIVQNLAENDNRIIHIIPERKDLGIGGCWNIGIHHKNCGQFAIQLDSDDIYSDYNTVQKIINGFYEQKCAMLIGTYQLTDFNLNEIPPGVIDHKEWTDENGRNNALRINGIGAPRAFYTPVLREIKFPNTSYGENYAVSLNISRIYKIGRIYDVLYLYRRWDNNSDADLDIKKQNEYNIYKDKIRTSELSARQNLLKKGSK